VTDKGRILNVSVRLPVTIRVSEDGAPRFVRSAGGLATGLEGARGEHEALWIGWPGITLEKLGALREGVDEKLAADRLRAVHLTESAEAGFYGSVANGVIWPVLHGLLERPPLEVRRWSDYLAANRQFADCVVAEWREGDVVWVHDYQLMLVPQLIRDRIPHARIGFFLHVPFPAAEIFAVLSEREALLRGILGADVIGVHTSGYQRNLMSSLRTFLGLRPGIDSVVHAGRTVRLGVFPMGVDAARFARLAARESVREREGELRASGTERTLLGIDRLDYTKGIPRRLLSFERLLERHPEWRERVRLLQVAVPSRANVAAYIRYREQVDGLVGRINGAYGTPSWTPVQYMYRSISPEEMVAYYRIADVMVVTPLRDGMNLVAKEFAAVRDDGDGVLVLSEFTGAADEMVGALCVNPYDIERTAEALHQALTMDEAERRERMGDMRARVTTSTVQHWRREFLDALEGTRGRVPVRIEAKAFDESALAHVVAADRLVLMLDYDGTVVPIRPRPEDAAPDEAVMTLLRALATLDDTDVHIVSGRRYQDLEDWFHSLPLALHAEHGLWTREAGSVHWQRALLLDDDWKPAVREVLERFTARTPGTFIEEKTAGFAWHYRLAREGAARWQSNELRAHLVEILAEAPVQVLEGKAVLEVRQEGIHKGLLAARLAAAHPEATLAAIGDDRTDDDMFAALPEGAITIAVGDLPRRAHWRVETQPEVVDLLRAIVRRRRRTSGLLQYA
jgi:trehalose 6-phosphate synthase/phosphatase